MVNAEKHHRKSGLVAAIALAGLCFGGSTVAAQDADGSLLTEIAGGFDFLANVATSGDDKGLIYALEHHTGRIRIIDDGNVLPDDFLDLSDRITDEPDLEQGLMAMAFPPNFPDASVVYITYTNKSDEIVLSRFLVAEDALSADPASEEQLLSQGTFVSYHHCGNITFNPVNGYLYMCIGDSDAEGNPRGTAQDLNTLQGSILRLDVGAHDAGYTVPDDNPFTGKPDIRPEIWAYGFRNPWNFSFDRLTGDLYVPDVGWKSWEELNYEPAGITGGLNYGWALAEGNDCRLSCETSEIIEKRMTVTGTTDIVWPVYDYPHGEPGCSISGGAVYRGEAAPEWHGVYVFSDWCTGQVWGLRQPGENPELTLIAEAPINPTAVKPGPNGELLVIDGTFGAGSVHSLKLPSYADSSWLSMAEIAYEHAKYARRNSVGAIRTDLELILNSRRWRWTEPIFDMILGEIGTCENC